MSGPDLPNGMVTIGEALAGFLTELEERCEQHAPGVPYGTLNARLERTRKGPRDSSQSGGLND
jgi:hypothetical protein